jgi:4-hydroxy-tetrahydrodipicolinate synthase
MATMVGSALDGKWDTARAEYHSLLPLMQANFWEPSPSPVKAVMAMMGRMSETLRLPLTPVTATTRAKLGAVAAEYGLLKN